MASSGERRAGGQGRVKDPRMDGRLKHNRERGVSLASTRADRLPGGQGRVKNSTSDRRLKQNRQRHEGEEHHGDGP
jgi:hypothetical protein